MKFRVIFEIDEEAEADDREEAVERATGNVVGGQALVDEFGDFESVYKELQRLREESKQMFDLLEMVARGITFDCDTEDVIRITSAVKRFCISKRESERG